uniref:BHLH domain-containing protein n=1 Tax=Kalanchoe fedtschenkoi TaxID=63787 RepID=A0A7N1A2M5_KALFE
MEEQEEGCGGRGPINLTSSSVDCREELGLCVECLVGPSASTDSLSASLGLGDRMPFLRMLQTLDPSNLQSPSRKYKPKAENQVLEVDSCLTHDMPDLHSPVMSEGKNPTRACPDGILEEKGELDSVNECRQNSCSEKQALLSCGRKRKPKRTKEVVENKMDKEKQRMTHIAIERNRRRQMSEYLGVLRPLLPPAYAQKGDQASIVGGAIDYIKKLEQLLQSLQAQKRQRKMEDEMRRSSNSIPTPPETSDALSTSTSSPSASLDENSLEHGKKADVNIRVVQTHVNLHIECNNVKQSQLIKLMIALEELGLTILHLNITSTHKSSFYSLSLKVEEESKVRSAEEVSASIEKVLNSINIYDGRRSSVRNQN